jgi:peroxiredoxin
MIELGQLEARHGDFDSHHLRIFAVSMDGLEDSTKTQNQFPHVVVVSDSNHGLANAVGTVAPQQGPGGVETNAPTTILVDRHGDVRWLFRPDRFLERLSPDEVLTAAAKHLQAN